MALLFVGLLVSSSTLRLAAEISLLLGRWPTFSTRFSLSPLVESFGFSTMSCCSFFCRSLFGFFRCCACCALNMPDWLLLWPTMPGRPALSWDKGNIAVLLRSMPSAWSSPSSFFIQLDFPRSYNPPNVFIRILPILLILETPDLLAAAFGASTLLPLLKWL